jgi:hypothetical protein
MNAVRLQALHNTFYYRCVTFSFSPENIGVLIYEGGTAAVPPLNNFILICSNMCLSTDTIFATMPPIHAFYPRIHLLRRYTLKKCIFVSAKTFSDNGNMFQASTLYLTISFVCWYVLSGDDMFCPNMFCLDIFIPICFGCQCVLSLISFAADKFCPWYVLSSIHFGLILYSLGKYVLSWARILKHFEMYFS